MTACPRTARPGHGRRHAVEDVLNPSLEGQRVKACTVRQARHTGELKGFTSVEVERAVYLCPMHPERLLCSEGTCPRDHLAKLHPADDVDASSSRQSA